MLCIRCTVHIYIYIYLFIYLFKYLFIYICVCVCARACVCVQCAQAPLTTFSLKKKKTLLQYPLTGTAMDSWFIGIFQSSFKTFESTRDLWHQSLNPTGQLNLALIRTSIVAPSAAEPDLGQQRVNLQDSNQNEI